MKQILIVEDDRQLNSGLCKALAEPERKMHSSFTIAQARKQLASASIDLVLLDIGLPDGSGITLLRECKSAKPTLPIILLTANDTDIDIVEGLESGADDYITKPFSLAVLRARVNTQLRKYSSDAASDFMYQNDKFSFDFEKMKYKVCGELVELGKNEQKLLRVLGQNKGVTVSRNRLIDRIWTDGAELVEENALSVIVKRLRDKLDAGTEIKTVYGIGYSWVEKDD